MQSPSPIGGPRGLWQIVARRWWVVVPLFVITLAATVLFINGLPPLYQASATFVVTPSGSASSPAPAAPLTGQPELMSTIAEVAESRTIRERATSIVGTPAAGRDAEVDAQVVPGTYLLRIIVTSANPVLAERFADAVGAQTSAYERELLRGLAITGLDAALLPDRPVEPNVPLSLLIGFLAAIVLGVTSALALYLVRPDWTRPGGDPYARYRRRTRRMPAARSISSAAGAAPGSPRGPAG
jgi:succinoglycan biosynthesis transport protein ExoP